MTNQIEIQRIEDSTLKELATIVESYNREKKDQEVKLLREKLEDLKWKLGMKIKTMKIRNASHNILKFKHDQVDRQCKIEENTVNKQHAKIDSYLNECSNKTTEIREKLQQSKQEWRKKEEIFLPDFLLGFPDHCPIFPL